MPATKTTPTKPSGLAAQLDTTTGARILTCNPRPYGERFRWRGREAGTGLPFQLIARCTQPTGRTKPIVPETTLEIMVQGVNGRAQSVPNNSIFFTVPPVTAAEIRDAVETPAATAPNGNGTGKTNSNGSRTVSRVS